MHTQPPPARQQLNSERLRAILRPDRCGRVRAVRNSPSDVAACRRVVRRHTCSLVTRRMTRATQAQAGPGAHIGRPAQTLHQKRAIRPATRPARFWEARWQVGREQHCLSRNATKRHDLTIFASHFRGRVGLKKKVPLGVRLKSTRRRRPRFFCHTSSRGPEIKILDRGCAMVITSDDNNAQWSMKTQQAVSHCPSAIWKSDPHQFTTTAPFSGSAPTHGERLSFGGVFNFFCAMPRKKGEFLP